MAVRNFWVDADIDGYKTMFKGGPRSKDGGMQVTIYQRKDGCITTGLRINCGEYDGQLELRAYDGAGNLVFTNETER